MNIGIVLVSAEWGGAQRVVHELVRPLAKEKNVHVTVFVNSEIYPYYRDLNGINIADIGTYTSTNIAGLFFNYLRLKRNLKSLVKQYHIELLNTHLEMSILVSPHMKSVITFHGGEIDNLVHPRNIYYRLFFGRAVKHALDTCSRIITVSSWFQERLPEKYARKSSVIPNGVDSKTFIKQRKTENRKPVILFTGRYIERKGLLEILTVANLLPKYEFWFAGEGPLAHTITLPNTKNMGFRSTDTLVDLCNQARICIFPSYWEGFPLCGLEAMACGKAIIATPLGFSEYVENGKDGLLIPSKNIRALKNAIVLLMENDKLRKTIEINARKKALTYSWDRAARAYVRVFKKILA